jgi:hypothetical protein
MQRIKFSNAQTKRLHLNIEHAAGLDLPFVEPITNGGTLAITGSGATLFEPTCFEHLQRHIRDGGQVMACKESIRMLRERGVPVDFSCSMDPGPEQTRKTFIDRDITYFVASSCSPVLFQHLMYRKCKVVVFHSACGAEEIRWVPAVPHPQTVDGYAVVTPGVTRGEGPDGAIATPVYPVVLRNEQTLYETHWGEIGQPIASGGLCVINRAISLGRQLGFDRFELFGVGMGYRQGASYYAPGMVERAGNDGLELCDNGLIDGRPWMTRPDLLVSARDLYDDINGGSVVIHGDSLATSLAKRSRAFVNEAAPRT